MGIKNLKNAKSRRPLSNMVRSCFALMVVLCVVGGAMAAGEPDPTPTPAPDNDGDFGIWDIFDKKEIVQSAKDAWKELGPAGGNLLIGVGLVVAILSIILALLGGAGAMNLGKMGSDNDTHSKGKSMMGTAVGSAILLVLLLCFVAMFFAGWL